MKLTAIETELSASIKADLISIGTAQVDKSLLQAQLKSTTTTEPVACVSSIFLIA